MQNGKPVFILLCSFQKPEPWQPSYQAPMPEGIPPPEECEEVEGTYDRLSQSSEVHPEIRSYAAEYVQVGTANPCARLPDLSGWLQERKKSPLEIRNAKIVTSEDGVKTIMYWYRIRSMKRYEPSFQKVTQRGIYNDKLLTSVPSAY